MNLDDERVKSGQGPNTKADEPLAPLEELRRQLAGRLENHAADATEVERNSDADSRARKS